MVPYLVLMMSYAGEKKIKNTKVTKTLNNKIDVSINNVIHH